MGYFRQNNTSQRISYCWRDAIPPTIRCIAIPIQYNNIGLSPGKVSTSRVAHVQISVFGFPALNFSPSRAEHWVVAQDVRKMLLSFYFEDKRFLLLCFLKCAKQIYHYSANTAGLRFTIYEYDTICLLYQTETLFEPRPVRFLDKSWGQCSPSWLGWHVLKIAKSLKIDVRNYWENLKTN